MAVFMVIWIGDGASNGQTKRPKHRSLARQQEHTQCLLVAVASISKQHDVGQSLLNLRSAIWEEISSPNPNQSHCLSSHEFKAILSIHSDNSTPKSTSSSINYTL